MVCPRCAKHTFIHTTSIMNMDEICLPCKAEERNHPLYIEAQQAEIHSLKQGEGLFQGLFFDKTWEQIRSLEAVSQT
jgi:hypothetical protein